MLGKPFETLTADDIRQLGSTGIPEGRELEFKETLPSNSSGGRKKFLAAISSFANTNGGLLLFGVPEVRDENGKPTGVAGAPCGLSVENMGLEISRLDNVIQTGLQPRISGIRTMAIGGFPTGPVLALYIPRSWSAPHMITFEDWNRFYTRNNSGKVLMDVTQIRAAFARRESLSEGVQGLRSHRIQLIEAGNTPVPIMKGPKVIYHVLPIGFADPVVSLDIGSVATEKARMHVLFDSGYYSSAFNFDGFVWWDQPGGEPPQIPSYVQLFRNGLVEAVDGVELICHGDKKLIPSSSFEEGLIQATNTYSHFLRRLGISDPLVLMLTLLNVRGYQLGVASGIRDTRHVHPIERDVLIFPDVLMDDTDVPVATLLKRTFDNLWQAAGWSGSLNYKGDERKVR